MTWTTFFKSHSFKRGFVAGGFGLAVGAGGSAAIALKIASHCSTAIASFISEMSQNITISELNAIVHLGRYNATLTLDDINAAFPAGWLDVINHATDLSPYCFTVPFTIGLCITAAASLALASTVAVAVHIRDEGESPRMPQHHQPEAINDDVETQSLLMPH